MNIIFKKVMVLIITVVVLLCVVNIFSFAEQNIVFKLGHNSPEDSVYHVGALKVAELVEKYSEGKMKIDIYSGGALGGELEMMDGLRMGTLDMSIINSGNIGKYAPKWSIFYLPYLFQDDDHLLRFSKSEMAQGLIDYTREKANIHILLPFWCDGFRHTMQNVREVKVPKDLHGIKMRVPEFPILIEFMKEFGAIPVAMPFPEVYLSLTTGIVDGLETSPWALLSGKFYEVCKYVTLDGHLVSPTLLCMNINRYDTLTDAQKKILDKAAYEGGTYQYEYSRQFNIDAIEKLKEFCVVTEVDKQIWMDACQPIIEKFAPDMDQELLQGIRDLEE